MIVRRKIFERYEKYQFNIPYKSGDKPLVKMGDKLKKGTKLLRKKGSNIKYSFYLPEQIGGEASKALNFINCIDGEFMNKGDILAQRVVAGGLTVKKLISPTQGVVDLSRIDRGYLDLLGEESELLVKSTFTGAVEELNPVDGINIVSGTYALDILAISDLSLRNTQDSKIIGEFVVLGDGKELLLQSEEESYKDKIVFVGKYLHPELMFDLFEKGALFVLTYSMEYEDFRRRGLPVGVIGGFGEIYSSNKMVDFIASIKQNFAIVDYTESQMFFVTDSKTYKAKEDLFVKSASGSAVISRSLSNYGMLGEIESVEDDVVVTVKWETGQRTMINIGSLEFVSL